MLRLLSRNEDIAFVSGLERFIEFGERKFFHVWTSEGSSWLMRLSLIALVRSLATNPVPML